MFAGKDEEQAAAELEKPAEPEEQKPTSAEPEQQEPPSTEPEQKPAESEKQPEPAAAGGRYFYTCTCGFTILQFWNPSQIFFVQAPQ